MYLTSKENKQTNKKFQVYISLTGIMYYTYVEGDKGGMFVGIEKIGKAKTRGESMDFECCDYDRKS